MTLYVSVQVGRRALASTSMNFAAFPGASQAILQYHLVQAMQAAAVARLSPSFVPPRLF